MSKVDVFLARVLREEGKKPFAYNDKTGKRVTCKTDDPQTSGNLSIGEGINLEVGLDDEEIAWLTRHRAEKVDQPLSALPWYVELDDVRGSVPLDIAFNAGLNGFLHGFPHMVTALERGDLASAATECHVADPTLDESRYAPLRQLLLAGGTI